MNATRKVKLKDITGNLTCKLCLGYLIDATTIIECLHSFCKSCILKHLEKSVEREEKYCPVCDVQLHSTKPFTSIRADLMLQEIVYKLVPGLFKNEMSRRRSFYAETQSSTPINQEDSGQVFDELYITSDTVMHLSLEYVTDDIKLKESTRRFLKCPAAVNVHILKKFIQGKYDLPLEATIDVMFGDRILPDDFLLMDIAYKYSWTMNGSKPLNLSYRIRDIEKKPEIKSEITINEEVNPADEKLLKLAADEPVNTTTNRKKVCHENGNNIMPSEEPKKNPLKLNGSGILSGEITITPSKTEKGRGRKRKNLNHSGMSIEESHEPAVKVPSKKAKLPKSRNSTNTTSQTCNAFQQTVKSEGDEVIVTEKSDSNKEMKEVQLHISENGVMSARSGKEKFILKSEASTSTSSNCISIPSPTMSKNVAEKLLLTGSFQTKTGPTGVMEIICDKPDHLSACPKPSIAKPGYVTLNIPNPTNSLLSHPDLYRTIYPDCDKTAKDPNSIQIVTPSPNQNGKSTSSQSIQNGKSPKKKVSKEKSSLLEKIKSQIASKKKGKDGENVIKAIKDLGKLHNNVGDIGNSTPPDDIAPSEAPKISSGIHSLPIVSTLLHKPIRPKPPNGTIKHSGNLSYNLPLALNFSPSSGMSVSMIPCTSTANSPKSTNTCVISTVSTSTSNQSTTPPKRLSHQTTVVNGDLKFTTSPKPATPENGQDNDSPKKTPKFFKSRHAAAPTNPVKSKQTSLMQSQNSKRKTPVKGVNGLDDPNPNPKKKSKKFPEVSSQSIALSNVETPLLLGLQQTLANSVLPISSLNGLVNGGSLPFPPSKSTVSSSATTLPISVEKYSQHLNALSNLTANSADAFNSSSFGMAAAAATAAAAVGMPNGNGIHNNSGSLGMVPFVTDNYCSMPFLNQRPAIQQLPLGFGYGYQNLAAANLYSMNMLKNLTSKPQETINAQPVKCEDKESPTLDLTTGNKANNNSNKEGQESNSNGDSKNHPLLANLLHPSKNPLTPISSPIRLTTNGNSTEKRERKLSKSPINKIINGIVDRAQSPKGKHPSIPQVDEKNKADSRGESALHNGTKPRLTDDTAFNGSHSKNNSEISSQDCSSDLATKNINNGTVPNGPNDLSPTPSAKNNNNNNNRTTISSFNNDKMAKPSSDINSDCANLKNGPNGSQNSSEVSPKPSSA